MTSPGSRLGENAVNETNMHEMAAALQSSGMVAAGYDTMNVVCNGWMARNSSGVLQENRQKWPNGIAAYAQYLHSQTPPLKLGCYTSPSPTNCCGEPRRGRRCHSALSFAVVRRDSIYRKGRFGAITVHLLPSFKFRRARLTGARGDRHGVLRAGM